METLRSRPSSIQYQFDVLLEDPRIIFTDDDCRGISKTHLDAQVVELIISNYQVIRILVDKENSADIIFLETLKRMRFKQKLLEVFQSNLVGFNRQKTAILAQIQLPKTAKTETMLVDFLVIDNLSSFNAY